MIKNNKINHYYWLDAIRFIAAFMVLFSHTRNDFFMAYGELPVEQQSFFSFAFYLLGRLGHEAVVVFFVLSGFLVGGRGIERIMSGNMDVRSYAIDRFSRIYPPLLFSIILYFLTCQFVLTEKWDWGIALGNLLNFQGIFCDTLVSPFWSLSYEWWFYIVFGSIIIATGKRKILGLVVTCTALLVFTIGDMSLVYLLIWFVGALAYIVRPKNPNKIVLFISIIGIAVCIALYQMSTETRSVEVSFAIKNQPLIEILMSLFMCLLIQQVILIEPKTPFSKRIESGLGYMGNFSYTLYLSHRIVMMWFFYYVFEKGGGDMSYKSILSYLVLAICCLFICWLLSLISEKYTPQIKHYLKNTLIK